MEKERTSICLSMCKSDLASLDALSEFLTQLNGYRFTRTMTIVFLIKFYRDNFSFSDIKGGIEGQEKLPLPF